MTRPPLAGDRTDYRAKRRRRDPAEMRRCRERQKNGKAIRRVQVHTHRFAKAIIAVGVLTYEQTRGRSLVERELARLVDEWVASVERSPEWAALWGD